MIYKQLWNCGVWTTGVAAGLYLLTWFVMARWRSGVLIGGVEALWLKFLIRAAYAGIAILFLGAMDAVVADLLLGRH